MGVLIPHPAGPGLGRQFATRKEIRARYRIRADQYDDHFASLFCHTCALTQERQEIELEEGSFS